MWQSVPFSKLLGIRREAVKNFFFPLLFSKKNVVKYPARSTLAKMAAKDKQKVAFLLQYKGRVLDEAFCHQYFRKLKIDKIEGSVFSVCLKFLGI